MVGYIFEATVRAYKNVYNKCMFYNIKTTTYLISEFNAFFDQWMEDGESGVPLGAAVPDAKKRENEYVTIPLLQEMEPQNVRVATA